jgi:hypothetical protein
MRTWFVAPHGSDLSASNNEYKLKGSRSQGH